MEPDQNTSSISAVAELYAMKAKKEIEIGILERSLSPNNKNFKNLTMNWTS